MKLIRKKAFVLLVCLALCAAFLTGCGRSLVITTGFGRGEVFRLGKKKGTIAEARVYILDLQKESETLYGEAIWESADSEKMQQAVKDQALARLTRVKALNQIALDRDVMLTSLEERLAKEAEQNYYRGLSEAERTYLGMNEKGLLQMFREYALAARLWKSMGESAPKTYEDYYSGIQCDLNTGYWQKVSLKRLEGDLTAPGFGQSYAEAFADVKYPSDLESDEAADGKEAEEGEKTGDAGREDPSEDPEETGDGH